MTSSIMTIEDFNALPAGTVMNYKGGGRGWWPDEDYDRQVNGTLMWALHKLGAGMRNQNTVASHNTFFTVDVEPVDADDLRSAVSDLLAIWADKGIKRQFDLVNVMTGRGEFCLREYDRPKCYWARLGRTWLEKAFLFRGYRWVYGRAECLKNFPDQLERIALALDGRDLIAESRAEMVEVA